MSTGEHSAPDRHRRGYLHRNSRDDGGPRVHQGYLAEREPGEVYVLSPRHRTRDSRVTRLHPQSLTQQVP